MGIDVPDGSAPAEQPKPALEKSQATNKTNNKKCMVIAAVLCSCAVVGSLLLGLLPDWGDEKLLPTTPTKGTYPPTGPEGFGPSQSQQLYYESDSGPFKLKIPLFSSNITAGYPSLADAEQDVQQLAMFLLNDAIMSNSRFGCYRGPVVDVDEEMPQGTPVMSPPAGTNDAAADGMAAESNLAAGSNGDLENANDFETNNQEENVDRGDLAKSDGTFIFTAYGHYLVVVTADAGNEIARVEIPPIEVPQGFMGSGSMEEPMMDVQPGMDMPPYHWNPRPHIDSILLEGNRLAVIASGYSIEYTPPVGALGLQQPIFWDYHNTKVHLYNVNGGDIEYLTSRSLQGSFRNAFSMDNNGYIVTQAGINTWSLLEPIQCWQDRFAGLGGDEYVQVAATVAQEEVIPHFVSALLDALQSNGPIQLTRLSMYADSVSLDGEAELSLFSGGIANSVTYVVAFNMFEDIGHGDELTLGGDELTLNTAATFQPGNWGHVYAHEKMIIVADQGWHWNEEEQSSGDMTYLLGFSLQGSTATHSAVGSVPGHILSPYSIDFVEFEGESYLRVATTQNFWSRWGGGFIVDDGVVGITVVNEGSDATDAMDGEQAGSSTTGSATGGADLEVAAGDGDFDSDGEVRDEEEQESSTLNRIIVLKFPNTMVAENELVLVGEAEMGKPNERFTTVRFFDSFAYAVTFERMDPFYVIDFSENPEIPNVKGELDVLGFSEYLHPITSNNTILAAVGQLADETGRVQGMQISLFDARNASSPTLLARLPITDESENSWSSSPVSWDPRAFRFLSLGEGTGYLIMPLSTYTYPNNGFAEEGESYPEPEYFEGFVVFEIDALHPEDDMRIKRVLNIDHTDSASFEAGYYYCSWLPERSFVVSGHLITLKAHSIVSTNLALVSEVSDASAAEVWSFEADQELGGCPVYRL